MLRAELREDAPELRMATHAGERAELEAVARLEQLRGDRAPRHCPAPGSAYLHREPEPVVRQPPRLMPLRRLGDVVQHVLDAQIRVLRVARAVQLEPYTMDGVRLCLAEARLEARRIVRGILPLGEGDDLHVESALQRELHPAQRRLLTGRVGVEAEKKPLRQTDELLQLL